MNTNAPGLRYSQISFAVLLVMAMGMPMMIFYAIGILGPLLISDLNLSFQQLGLLVSCTFGCAAVLSPWSGIIVEKLGARTGLMGLFLLVGLSFTLLALLPGFEGLLIALLFCGLAQSLANPATNLTIAQNIPSVNKASMVGLKQSGVQVSALLAGVVLPTLVMLLGWRGALASWAPIALLMALMSARLLSRYPPKPQQRSLRLTLPNKLLIVLALIQLCAGLTLSSFITFIGIHAQQLGISDSTLGSMVACFGVMGILSRVLLTPLGAHLHDETLLLAAAFFLACLALAIMQYADTDRHWPLWTGVIGMGLTVVATNAIAMSMLLRDARFGSAATSAGILSAGFFGGFALGPPLFGWLLIRTTGVSILYCQLVPLLTGCLLSLLLLRLRQRRCET